MLASVVVSFDEAPAASMPFIETPCLSAEATAELAMPIRSPLTVNVSPETACTVAPRERAAPVSRRSPDTTRAIESAVVFMTARRSRARRKQSTRFVGT